MSGMEIERFIDLTANLLAVLQKEPPSPAADAIFDEFRGELMDSGWASPEGWRVAIADVLGVTDILAGELDDSPA